MNSLYPVDPLEHQLLRAERAPIPILVGTIGRLTLKNLYKLWQRTTKALVVIGVCVWSSSCSNESTNASSRSTSSSSKNKQEIIVEGVSTNPTTDRFGFVRWVKRQEDIVTAYAQWISGENRLKIRLLTFSMTEEEISTIAEEEHFFSQPQFYYPSGQSLKPSAGLDLTFSASQPTLETLDSYFFYAYRMDKDPNQSINVTLYQDLARADFENLTIDLTKRRTQFEFTLENDILGQTLSVQLNLDVKIFVQASP